MSTSVNTGLGSRIFNHIQTSSSRFVRLKMPEVVLQQLLNIGWITLGNTTLIPIHRKNIIYSSRKAHPINILGHLFTSLPSSMSSQKYQKKPKIAIYLWYLWTVKSMDLEARKQPESDMEMGWVILGHTFSCGYVISRAKSGICC